MIIVNFKTYKQASLSAAVKLAESIKEVSENSGVKIIACPQEVDLKEVRQVLPEATWAQHVDPVKRGRGTGRFPVEVAKEAGVTGVLLNHSEHRISAGVLGEAMATCKSLGLTTTIFAGSIEEARIVAKFNPDFLAYEPPELIASPDTSVARSKPEVIKDVVDEFKDMKILVGAGIKDANDVKVSLELGAVGIAIASAVILAEDPKVVLTSLASEFKR